MGFPKLQTTRSIGDISDEPEREQKNIGIQVSIQTGGIIEALNLLPSTKDEDYTELLIDLRYLQDRAKVLAQYFHGLSVCLEENKVWVHHLSQNKSDNHLIENLDISRQVLELAIRKNSS